MRLISAIILCLATSLYGWTGTLTEHIGKQCHVVEGEHHEEALADHVDQHNHDAEDASHDSENDCQPEHCSDHCSLCHVSTAGFASTMVEQEQHRIPLIKERSIGNLIAPDSIASRPDTPPPKA